MECKLRLWWKSKLGDIVIDFNKINPFKRKYLRIDWSSSILLPWTTTSFQASLYDRIYVEGHLLKILIVILYIQQGYIHRLRNNVGWESSIIKMLHMIDFYQNYDSMYEYHCAQGKKRVWGKHLSRHRCTIPIRIYITSIRSLKIYMYNDKMLTPPTG